MSNLPSEPSLVDSGSSKPEHDATAVASHTASSRHDPNQPIDLLGFLKGLVRHWFAGLLTFVVVAGILVGYSLFIAPKDTVGKVAAHGHIMVTLPEPRTEAQAIIESSTVSTIMSNYVALATPEPTVKAAVKYLHDGTTADDLKKAASVHWGGGGTVIAVYALGTDEGQAIRRANAYARAFTETANAVAPSPLHGLPHPKLTVVQQAFPSDPNLEAPKVKDSDDPGKMISPSVGVGAGLVLGLLVMGLLEYRSSRRRNASA
ncbi:chain-length determining protein [Cutibacterium avidum]|uniref:chain-length determining protein n=1 Tax=Cutibacterium avidum TaxID=33010 RepID=UPI00192AE2A8|nr:chain-length determining protein [Cutibacterium avidum]QQY15889.1 chain-length determining protein [Cutibacterium avidum]